MSAAVETLLAPAAGYRSRDVARYLWQLEAVRDELLRSLKDMDEAELHRQPAPGMNTIAMLMAHIAYAESHLVQVGIEGKPSSDTKSVIGISEQDEGMPLAADAPEAPVIAALSLDALRDMLARARARTREVAATLGDEDLARRIVRRRPNGAERVFDVAWVLHHLIEHEAGHRSQVLLLRHLYKTERGAWRGAPSSGPGRTSA